MKTSFRFMMPLFAMIAFFSALNIASSQTTGDTIRVQAFNFNSESRDTMISFPTDDNLTYEKVLLKYTMRCKDGLISTASNVNQGCGQWDFSCNTYLADSTNPESVLTIIPSHFITNYDDTTFPFKSTPTYHYLRSAQTSVDIVSTNSESIASVGSGTEALDRSLSTDHSANKSQYLYTASELNAAGLTAGEIHGFDLTVLDAAGEAQFLKIKMKNSTKSELNGLVDEDDFTEVYYQNHTFDANSESRFQFNNPFIWDGASNILVEFSFTNALADLSSTIVEGENTTEAMGLTSTNEKEIILTNNAYVQCDTYTGVVGSQNRTVEAWIRTTDGSNGEIIGYGTITTSRKWVFRFANGLLRLEVHGGGTESATRVDDGKWHHVACVLNGDDLGDVSFYVDGVLDGKSTTSTAAVNTNPSNVRISRGLSNRYIDASIDDVRIWDTNLSEETINAWKNLKIDKNHPNYDNLQLNFEFDGEGNVITDSSPLGNHGTLIGDRYSISEVSGPELFKDFTLENNRPNINFFQGDYETTESTVDVDRPIAKELRHIVVSREIETTDPNFALDDNIITSEAVEYWTPEETIYDEATGAELTSNTLTPDGEINIEELEYQRRFPYYNELVSFVTPYGIDLDFGLEGASWVFDMTDYISILKGKKRLLMTLGGQRQEDMDLEFQFIVGTPPRDVLQYEQLWQGTNRIGIAQLAQIQSNEKFSPLDINIVNGAEKVVLKSSITGHGSEGEFQGNGGVINHMINVNQSEEFVWSVHKECSFNPIFPQGGTWIFDRQGWCPGERSIITEHDLTSMVSPGGSVNVDYNISSPQVFGGDYRYHVSHQLVSYGPANFQTDASIVNIVAPNNAPEFTRVGTVCANPTIIIQNTGGQDLTNLTINYWINDSQAPQSFEWTGNLAFMETEEVILPNSAALWFDLLSDNNKFYAEVSNPNGGTDEYTYNNRFTADFDFPEVLPNNISIEFRTNNFPIENSYQLIDGEGNVVGANDLTTPNNTHVDDYELPEGCYKLIVTDSGGDGVQWWANPNQGVGFINILDESGDDLIRLEPDFGGGFELSFSTSFPVSVENIDFITSIEVFPNPASDYVSVKADDLLGANISMVNSMGQNVPNATISRNDKEIKLDISNLNTGLYYVVIQKNEVVTTRKVIKQ